MKFFNFLHKRKKKTDLEIEEEITNEIIEENIKEEQEEIKAIVIKYKVNDFNEEVPDIIKICNFHSELIPSEDSIIWAPNKEKTKLIPYKVVRIDYIEDLNTDAKNFIYIVVKDATINNII
jgi:hypothetical protein